MSALRDSQGRFRKSRLIGTVIVIGTLCFMGYAAMSKAFAKTVYQTTEKIVEVDNLGPKVAELKNALLDNLEKCESSGFSESDAPIIFDTNNKASIGTFQFQKSTVIHYYKTLYGKTITPKEATLIALDSTKARELASEIIFTTEKGVSNWLNCANKLNLSSEIKFIKKLK